MTQNQPKPYFVLHGKYDQGQGREEYSHYKTFADEASAKTYSLSHLPSVIGKKALSENKDQSYLVVGVREYSLYSMGEYDGTGKSYVAMRTTLPNLETTVEKISKIKEVQKTFAGLELKLGGEQ